MLFRFADKKNIGKIEKENFKYKYEISFMYETNMIITSFKQFNRPENTSIKLL